MLTIRADLIQRLEATPPAVAVTEVIDNVKESGCKQINGTFTVPLYVDSPDVRAALNRDAGGKVIADGSAEAEFVALIPPSVLARGASDPPARLVQLGHGFFGRCDELIKDFSFTIADTLGIVFVCTDTWGMSRPDMVPVVSDLATDPTAAMVFTDRTHQGMANLIALAYAATGPMADLAEFEVNGQPAYDATSIRYYGNSQGSILGGVYTALSPKVEQAYLGVGGASFGYIMFRSGSFGSFLEIIQSFLPDPLDVQKFGMLMSTPMDRIDPITYAPHVLSDTFPDGPAARRVLMHLGIGDAQVPNVAGDLYARVMGLGLLEPYVKEVGGLTHVSAPYDGSALVEFDFKLDLDPLPGTYADASPANEVHDGLRVLPAAMEQLDRFFQPDSLIEQTCDGICDPE